MKTALAALVLLPAAVLAAGPRQRILLDSGWRFHLGEIPGMEIRLPGTPIVSWRWTASAKGEADAPKLTGRDFQPEREGWSEIPTGRDIFGGRLGFAWLRTTLPRLKGSRHIVHFEGVDDNATVYLNGKRLTHHAGWSDPFDVDLTSEWSQTQPNVLAILVENTAGPGGITAPVALDESERPNTALSGVVAPNYDDQHWQAVHLPHDYVIEGKFTPTGDAGHGSIVPNTAWYRRTFQLAPSDIGKSIWLDFDGIYRDSQVWVNGHYLGRHKSGYTSFRYDVGDIVHLGSNTIAIHVDPTKFEGWWYEGGGIYRHVWLNIANPVHIKPWGTFVTTSLREPVNGVAPSTAMVRAHTRVVNTQSLGVGTAVESTISDDLGKTVARRQSFLGLRPHSEGLAGQDLQVSRPRLWSLESPHMYTLTTTIKLNGQVIDKAETPFGIRTIRYDAATGFYLNGKRVKIQGTCNHQDFIGVGIGVPDTLEAWRVSKLKAMGANAWRMSHNPPTISLLDECDRQGMLVMDENRHLGSNDAVLQELGDLVQRDRNHPSVIMWSMCNEQSEAGSAEGGNTFRAMMDTVRKYDASRPISCAMNSGWFGQGFTNVEDLMGVNYNTQVYDQFHRDHPNMPMFASETASTVTTRGEYADDRLKTYVSSYNMTDDSWSTVATRPFVAGSFVWTGFDYKGEPSPYGWPCINSHFGIMDMCGFPKDNYYYYTAWWKKAPSLHLLPDWTNWPGREGQDVKVIGFANAAKVELFLNGGSQGVRDVPKWGHVEWSVKYAQGTLSAKAFDSAGRLVASDAVVTTGAPASIRLTTDRTHLKEDGEDLAVVYAQILDTDGNVVPNSSDLVSFAAADGAIVGVGNGNPSDHDPDRASTRHAFHGLCAVLVRAHGKHAFVLTASADGLRPGRLKFTSN